MKPGDRDPQRSACLSHAAWERMLGDAILLSPQARSIGAALTETGVLLASFGEDPDWLPTDPQALSVCAPPR